MARQLDNWISSYLEWTNKTESPVQFNFWAAISIVAGALRRGIYVDRYYNKLYPNLYVILTGPTGCGKTHAADLAVDILNDIHPVEVIAEKITAPELMGSMQRSVDSGNGVGRIAEASVFLYFDELQHYFGSRTITDDFIPFLVKFHKPKKREGYRTKTKGRFIIENPSVNWLATTTPEWMASSVRQDAFEVGLMGRCIFVYGSEKHQHVPSPEREISREHIEIREALGHDLQEIANMKGAVSMSDTAYEWWVDWYKSRGIPSDKRMTGYYEREPDYMLKLAMIMSAVEDEAKHITLDHIEGAKEILDGVASAMPKAFSYMGTAQAVLAAKISRLLEMTNGACKVSFAIRALQTDIRSSKQFHDVVKLMIEAQQLQLETAPGSSGQKLLRSLIYAPKKPSRVHESSE